MKENPTFMLVVAGALQRADGRWLMHRRAMGKQHGGLWEFPGGKVEPGETPGIALIRELEEELGIRIELDSNSPACFAESRPQRGESAIVILLYRVAKWHGEPAALEGGGLGWFAPHEISELEKPPLDIELASRLLSDLAG